MGYNEVPSSWRRVSYNALQVDPRRVVHSELDKLEDADLSRPENDIGTKALSL